MQTARAHKNNILASNLLFGFWAFSLMTEVVRTKVLRAAEMSSLPAVVGVYLACIGLYYAIRLGKPWAKVILALLFVLAIVVGITKGLAGYSLLEAAQLHDYLYLVNDALSYIISAGALVLLARKPPPQAIA